MKPEVPSPAGFGVGDVNFPRTRLLCDGCPPLGWVGWISNTRTRLNENFGTPRCHMFKYIRKGTAMLRFKEIGSASCIFYLVPFFVFVA